MSLLPEAAWYRDIVRAVEMRQAGIRDRLGRPWSQHFERVAARLLFRNPAATRAQVEAALLHDAYMARGGGDHMLDELAIGSEARLVIRRTTPPPEADYFRDFEAIHAPETAIYLDYVRRLAGSGDMPAIEMKLADIHDTIDACRSGRTPVLVDQYRTRYEPSRIILENALTPGLDG
jgi:hypothetical protein